MSQLFRFNTFLAITIIFLSPFASAKSLDDKGRIDQLGEQFMTQIAKAEPEPAMALISAYLGVDPNQFQQRSDGIISDMARIETQAGKPISYHLLHKKSVAEHFYKLTYLLKYPQAALVWELNFYQADKGWHLVDVSFNTDINALFKESSE